MAEALVLPTSFSQQRPWFQDQLDPGGALYNVPFAVRLQGALDRAALGAALETIVERHEVLRTTFGVRDGAPVQVIAARRRVELPFVDLSHRAEPARDVEALAAAEATRGFDLARGPLLRATLVREAVDRHVLLLTAHHGVFDGWSTGVFFQELAAAYAARVAPATARALPELPLQYADYAVWQREWLAGTAAAAQLAFWRDTLRDAPELLELPTDRPRPKVQSHRGGIHVFDLPPSLVGSLRGLSQREGATLFMTLLAAFKTLLGRLSGQDDVVVGTPVANRGRVEIEGLIGCFVNTLALRTDLAGDPPFRELLARVRRTAVAAYARQELPFERVVEELQPRRSLAFAPLFQVMFTLQQDITPAAELPGVALSLTEVPSGTAKLDLTLFLKERGQGLQGVVEYATDLFDASSVARMMGQYRSLLEAAAARPETRCSRLPLLTGRERQQVLVDWNQTEMALPPDAWVQEQVAAQARRTPEALAVVGAGGESLTYHELNRRADVVAARLQKAGVGPERLVGLFLERTPDLLVALLGVLKAGAAYLPLDPAFPESRLAHMLADSGAPTLLVSRALQAAVPASKASVIVLEEAVEAGAGRPQPSVLHEESLAYVLYTSGSTGRPKGVAVSHGALLNFLESARREPGLGPQDRLCAVTTLSFDIAALELFLPLLAGGRVVLADRETAANGRALATLLDTSGSTVLQATPATWRLLLDAGWVGNHRLTALCGGEALPRELADALIPRVAALWNMYGPTETTVWSTCQQVTAGPGPVSIGRPFANTQAYVLDAHLSPVPVGVTGELYLGGAGVARGYLGRPELTAERFLPDALTPRPGARLYWTGDLARWRADGTLEVLGRVDHQVKVRGFRIELEEVETALLRHPGVARAVVAAREDTSGDKALVAWIVPAREGQPTPRELRDFLRGVLPEYMVPSAFVALATLPLTPNGKVDRRALPAPGREAGVECGPGDALPRTELEEAVAAIWCAVLGRETVGIHDNFFELGGHSLLAARVIARLRERLGVELSLRSLFQAPTVAGLAAALAADGGSERLPRGAAIPRIPRGGDLPLSRGQERLWFVQRMAPDRPVYNVPLALRLLGPLNVPALERAVAAVVARHEVLRMAFPSREGRPVAVVGEAVGIEQDDVSSIPQEQREDAAVRLVRDEARRPFDLERGPLSRVRLVRLAADDHLLLLNLHHIVCDLWSLGLLLRELSAAYATAVGGEAPGWPEPPVQYADYAAWQRRRDEADGSDSALEEWAGRLAGVPALELPTDRPRPALQSFSGATVSRPLPRRLVALLETLAAAEGATLFVTLLAAFLALLRRYTGQDDLAVGSPVTEREQPGLEELVGFFVNTLVLRADLRGDPSFRELIARVRETVLEAHAHRHVPFERLVERLQPRRALDRNPLFQAAFLFDDGPLGPLVLPGVGVVPVEVGTGTAKFDLMLAVGRGSDGLTASVEYATDLFDRDRMERFLGHFEVLLDAALADPDRALSTLPLLTPGERRQVLGDWNATAAEYPAQACLHELFEEQVRATPGAVALVAEEGQMTYAELNRRANQLAHLLRSRGVGPEVPVGICTERSLEMVVGLLGILKAGGAYVPLDPSYPAQRLAFMVEDTRVPVILAQERLVGLLPPHDAWVFRLDSDWDLVARDPAAQPAWEENPARLAAPENLAYIIYTSGSTGRPKGAMNTHRGICNRLLWMQEAYRLGPEDRVLQKTPFSFDVSVWEFFWPLLAGAALVVARPEGHRDSAYLAALIAEQAITTLHFVPSMLQAFLEEPRTSACRSLRRVICSGEALPLSLQERFFARLDTELHNLYGPTEAAVDVTFWACERGGARTAVPIGRPISNTQIYVVDARLQPVPAGVPGELLIGGDGLARGYVASPDKTAASFIPDPFAVDPGRRLYRTGDRVRWAPDGTLEYLGRLDRQAKLRGFRIEPGEVEAALAALPGVQQAAVLVREDVPGDKRLVAYVVGDLDAQAAPAALRASLRTRLPEHMVPAHVVILERLPLNGNGKVDGASLPVPVVSPAAGQPPRPPAGATEQLVARAWQEVLKVEAIGTRDNFFDLGGNSLLLLQVQSRLARALGRDVSLVEMFRHGTVEALAAYLDGGAPQAEGVRASAQRAAGRRDAFDRRRQRELARR